jgi:trimeric autotransporter adhesin
MKSLFKCMTFVLAACLLATSSATTHASLILALTQNNQLLQFDSATPGTTSGVVSITGIGAGFTLVGIDARPANNQIYGLAVSSNSAINRIYSLNQTTGVATLASTLSAPITGGSFGMDFNPVVDRLRVVSDTGQNYRINVDTGATTTDTDLAYGAADPNSGTAPGVVASAYTNGAGATTTTLYGIDLATQSLVIQNPPNAGTLTTVGSLNTIAFPEASFDIEGSTNRGFAVLNGIEFSSINLTTGAATYIGDIATNSSIIGITSISAIPEPTTVLLLGVVGGIGAVARWRKRKSVASV